jgi:hypothetical protein
VPWIADAGRFDIEDLDGFAARELVLNVRTSSSDLAPSIEIPKAWPAPQKF